MPEYGTKGEQNQLMIEIPRWDDFQHYKQRHPIWLKTYTRLIHDQNYRGLSPHQRAVLHGLWMIYALSGRQLTANTASLSSQLGLRVSKDQLESLRNAGFIEILASSVLAQRREEESRKTLASREPVDKSATQTNPQSPPDMLAHLRAQRGGANG